MKPPMPEKRIVEETLHGITIRDEFRYLEDASDLDTKRFVEEQNGWTRSLLDPLPGRHAIRARLEELLSIGILAAPQVGGNCYF